LANHYFGRAEVFGCEPEQAGDAYESLTTGQWTPVESPMTIADGLKTSLGHKNFPILQQHVKAIILVSEDEMKEAWQFAVSRLKQLVEPSAAAGLAGVLKHRNEVAIKAGVILCGGNMDLTQIELG
jgi:threonine dehydratase